jgi:hypothetical protein
MLDSGNRTTGGYVNGMGYVLPEIVVTPNGYYGGLNFTNIADYLTSHAHTNSTGWCAQYIRLALESGGFDSAGHPSAACDYDTCLISKGFSSMGYNSGYAP